MAGCDWQGRTDSLAGVRVLANDYTLFIQDNMKQPIPAGHWIGRADCAVFQTGFSKV